MDQIQKATGAAGSVEIGGKTYLLTRLRNKNMAQWQEFIKKRLRAAPNPFAQIKEDIKVLDRQNQARVLRMAYDNRVSRESLTSPQAQQIMEENESKGFMLWLSIRAEHPEVTYDEVLAGVEEMDMLATAEALEAISGMTGAKKNPAETNGESNGVL
jgi:hypothetical protein